jgi:hypothetical protein
VTEKKGGTASHVRKIMIIKLDGMREGGGGERCGDILFRDESLYYCLSVVYFFIFQLIFYLLNFFFMF